MPTERPTHFDTFSRLSDVMEKRRHLTIVELLDDELDGIGARHRCNGIAALRGITIGSSQPHIDVLTRTVRSQCGQFEK